MEILFCTECYGKMNIQQKRAYNYVINTIYLSKKNNKFCVIQADAGTYMKIQMIFEMF